MLKPLRAGDLFLDAFLRAVQAKTKTWQAVLLAQQLAERDASKNQHIHGHH